MKENNQSIIWRRKESENEKWKKKKKKSEIMAKIEEESVKAWRKWRKWNNDNGENVKEESHRKKQKEIWQYQYNDQCENGRRNVKTNVIMWKLIIVMKI